MNFQLPREQKTSGAFSISALSANAFRFIGGLPVAALAVAVGTTIFAGYQIEQLVQDRHNSVQYSVVKTPLLRNDLETIARRMTELNPALRIEAAQDKLSIVAMENVNYAEFLYALNALPSIERQIVWELPLLCITDCVSKSAFQAELRGYRQQIQASR